MVIQGAMTSLENLVGAGVPVAVVDDNRLGRECRERGVAVTTVVRLELATDDPGYLGVGAPGT